MTPPPFYLEEIASKVKGILYVAEPRVLEGEGWHMWGREKLGPNF